MDRPPIDLNQIRPQAIRRNGELVAFNTKTISIASAKARLADESGETGASSPTRDVAAQREMAV